LAAFQKVESFRSEVRELTMDTLEHTMPSAINDGSTLSSRVAFVFLAVAFIALFQVIYIEDLSPLFSYLGLTYYAPSILANLCAWALALIPAFLLNLCLDRPSQFILLLLYLCVYIPSSFVPLYMRLNPELNSIALGATLMAGFILMIVILRGEVQPYQFEAQDDRTFWYALWILFILMSAWIVAVFRGSLQLVALGDVYSSGLRFGSREIFEHSNVGFAVIMMYSAVNPLIISLGLQRRNWLLTFVGISGQILCYSTGGIKAIAFSIILILMLHLVVRRHLRHAAHLVTILAIALFSGTHASGGMLERDSAATLALNGVVARAFAIPGQLTGQYYDFFENHPHLHLANTKPFSWVLENPLNDDVILSIAEYYGGIPGVTSNAHFWAEDGLANFGYIGIVMVSVFAGIILRVVDRVSVRHEPCFTAMAFSFAGYNLCNVPLTTALLSGGLILSIALMFLAARHISQRPSDGFDGSLEYQRA
jgi:hypothetical protein